jgi:hypothetical protein
MRRTRDAATAGMVGEPDVERPAQRGLEGHDIAPEHAGRVFPSANLAEDVENYNHGGSRAPLIHV